MTAQINLKIHLASSTVASSSEPLLKVAHESKVATLWGRVDLVADYEACRFLPSEPAEVARIIESFCRSDEPIKAIHQLTEMVGSFILLLEDGGAIKFIYRSGEVEDPTYYGNVSDHLFIHSQWTEVLKQFNEIELSRPDLEYFFRHASVSESGTLFKHLGIFKPYALYSLNENGLSLLTHAFPGFHKVDPNRPPKFQIDDYIKAVSSYKNIYQSFSLGYSGGTDSHMLATTYDDKINQLITITFKEPYASLQRKKETMAAQAAAKKTQKKLTPAPVDFSSTEKHLTYFKHYVQYNPFSAYLAVHYYVLAEQAEAPAILTGQNADAIWGFGLHQLAVSKGASYSTSGSFIFKDFSVFLKPSRNKIRNLAAKYLSRYAIINSYRKLRFERLINIRRQYGSEYDSLRIFPYKMFLLHQYVNFCIAGDSTSWSSAARFYSKKAVLPFSSPMVLHVCSHIKRENYLDLKAPLRRLYTEFDPSLIDLEQESASSYKQWSKSPLLNEFQDKPLGKEILNLRAGFGIAKSDHPNHPYPLQEMHLYYLLGLIEESTNTTGHSLLKKLKAC